MGAWPNCTGGVWPISVLQAAIVGLGSMGRLYSQCFGRMEHCTLSAVVSRSAEAAGCPVYQTMDELFSAQQPDLVCVCTPTDLHPAHVQQALEHGCHVICEKPLALHRAQAEQLYALAERQKKQLFCAQVVRFASSSLWLREAVGSGRYGPVREAFFSRLSTRPHWCKDSWAYDAARSGLVPFDLHIHDLDLMLSLFGPPQHAVCEKSGASDLPFDEHLWFTYSYGTFTVRAEAAWYRAAIPFCSGWRVAFDKALALCRDGTLTVFEADREPYTLCETQQQSTGISVPATDMYDRELRHFVDCIAQNRPSELLKPDEILAVLDVLEHLNNA